MTVSSSWRKRQKTKFLCLIFFPVVFLSFLLIFFSSSCRLYKLEQQLEPDDAEFLSKVRYIITKKERKIFLELPDSEKEDFKEKFWERRDPDPSTEENEFKMEYFDRIERANELFISEGKPGWLTDRGRIYILFGPPMDRLTYPMGGDPSGRCSEVWYYGNFPVVFVDSMCSGNYRLVTYNLSAIRSLNLMYMHELSMAQAEAQQTIRADERRLFDFDLSIKKAVADEERFEGLVEIGIPYSELWFAAEEEKLKTVLDVELKLNDSEGSLVWEKKESYEIEIDEEELKKSKGKSYNMEIPVRISEDAGRLLGGKNKLHVRLKNRTGGEELRKVVEFKL